MEIKHSAGRKELKEGRRGGIKNFDRIPYKVPSLGRGSPPRGSPMIGALDMTKR